MSYYDSVYRDYELPSRASNVYRYLCDRANSDGQCWPSVRRIAKDLSLSPSTVKRAIDDLTVHGYIKIEQFPQKRCQQLAHVHRPRFFKIPHTQGISVCIR